jgi:hypothetical protein
MDYALKKTKKKKVIKDEASGRVATFNLGLWV